ncbi:hypothetical protein FMM05_01715 [Flavobacterium zepuense]|uniref:Lipoprotein n=1 Tax=Flavobacterium zepuense TaxID=2593302 RepID=A0A552VA77_9FLAO|nr:hypothetical protein [Flavobacterium zepuense]TRW27381.1 hypothetical protein FMM05_01715 [Flavobacterium zepuense]
MKNLAAFLLLLLLLCSCTGERKKIDNTFSYNEEIEELASDLFARYNKNTFFGYDNVQMLLLTKKQQRLLAKKLKCTDVSVIYTAKDTTGTDSIVLFRSPSQYYGNYYTIAVDMKKTPVHRPTEANSVRISGRVYYYQFRRPFYFSSLEATTVPDKPKHYCN